MASQSDLDISLSSSSTCMQSVKQQSDPGEENTNDNTNEQNKSLESLLTDLNIKLDANSINFSVYNDLLIALEDYISNETNLESIEIENLQKKHPLIMLALIEVFTKHSNKDIHLLSSRGLKNLYDYEPKAFKRLTKILGKIRTKEKLSALDIDIIATQLFLFQVDQSSPINKIVDDLFKRLNTIDTSRSTYPKELNSRSNLGDLKNDLKLVNLIKKRIVFEIGKYGIKKALNNLNLYSSQNTIPKKGKAHWLQMFSKTFTIVPNLLNALVSPITYHWTKNFSLDALIFPVSYAGRLLKVQNLSKIIFEEGVDNLSQEVLIDINEQIEGLSVRAQIEQKVNKPITKKIKLIIQTTMKILVPFALTASIASMSFLASTEAARIITDGHKRDCIEHIDVSNYECTYALNPLLSYNLPLVTSQFKDMINIGKYPDFLGEISIDENNESLMDLYKNQMEVNILILCETDECILEQYKEIIYQTHEQVINYLFVKDMPNIANLVNMLIEATPTRLFNNNKISSPNINELSFEEALILSNETIKDLKVLSRMPYLRRLDLYSELLLKKSTF